MRAKLYGFKLVVKADVPLEKFLQRLERFDNQRFPHAGKNRRAFISYKSGYDEFLATLVTETSSRAQIVEEEDQDAMDDGGHDPQPKVAYRVAMANELPKTREACCILFSKRRGTGVVATYKGSISITQVCNWIEKNYRDLVMEYRNAALSNPNGLTEKEIKSKFPAKGAVICRPVTKHTKLDDELKHLRRFASIEAHVPAQAEDPADLLRMETRLAKIHLSFDEHAQGESFRQKLLKYIRKKSVSTGAVVGYDDRGEEHRVLIDEERAFALDSIDYELVVSDDHLSSEKVASSPIFTKFRAFIVRNPDIFGA